MTENQQQMTPSEVEINLRRESLRSSLYLNTIILIAIIIIIFFFAVNQPKFMQIAYQINTEEEQRTYRIALSEYFC